MSCGLAANERRQLKDRAYGRDSAETTRYARRLGRQAATVRDPGKTKDCNKVIRLLNLSIDESLACEFLHICAFTRKYCPESDGGEFMGVVKAILITFPQFRGDFGWLNTEDVDEERAYLTGHA